MKIFIAAALVSLSLVSCGAAYGSELSFIDLGYTSEANQVEGVKVGSSSHTRIGLRYAEFYGDDIHIFGEGSLHLRAYEAMPENFAPANTVGLQLGGGARWHMMPISESLVPFLISRVSFVSDGTGTIAREQADFTVNKENGLRYSAGIGLRLLLGHGFFVDMENYFFDNPLFTTETTKVGAVESNKTVVDVSVSSRGILAGTLFSLGYRF